MSFPSILEIFVAIDVIYLFYLFISILNIWFIYITKLSWIFLRE